MVLDGPNNAVEMIRKGRIQYRQLPIQQRLEGSSDFWPDYKGA
jgi:spermidine/putrescine transport system substrate-binding protein